MRIIIILALLILLCLSSCITFNRRYEYNLTDSTYWRYDYRSVWEKGEVYDEYFLKYGYNPQKYYCYRTDSFTINIHRVTEQSNLYSIGLLIPIIPIFSNFEEVNGYNDIGHLICEFMSEDSLIIKNSYLELDGKYKFRPIMGADCSQRIDGEFYQKIDTNHLWYYKEYRVAHAEFVMWFNLKELVKDSAVLYLDSVYVNNQLVSIPPLSLKKEYIYYFDEEIFGRMK